MALVDFTAYAWKMTGPLGGVVFQRTHTVMMVRTNSKPLIHGTIHQVARRVAFGGRSSSWRGIAKNDKKGWRFWAGRTKRPNSKGESRKTTGFNAFMGLSVMLQMAREEVPPEPPDVEGVAALPLWEFEADSEFQMVQGEVPTIGFDRNLPHDLLFIYGGKSTRGGNLKRPNRWKWITHLKGSATSPPPTPLIIANHPAKIKAGSQIWIALVHVDPERRISTRSFLTALAT